VSDDPRRSRRQFLATALWATGGVALAPAIGQPRGKPGPRPVRLAFAADPLPLDFVRPRDFMATQAAHLLGDSLVWFDRELKPVPRVARRWTWSRDHLELTFQLREGVRWHDGRPVTAADVAHTWRVAVDPGQGPVDRGLALVEKVDIVEQRTVRARYAKPFAPALVAWSTALAPSHKPWAPDRPLGCGPWRFTRWDRGQRIVLDAFKDYFEGPPRAERLELEVVRDFATRFAALRAGQVDVAGLSPDFYKQALADEDLLARFNVVKYRMLYYWSITWRCAADHPLFGDQRVRRAMTLAIDRQGYLARVAGGFGDVAVTSFHPDLWGHDPKLKPWPFDPREAEAALDAAGWRRPAGRDVRERGGRAFSFRLTYPQTTSENQRIAEFVQENLRAVGVAMELEPLEWSVFLQRRSGREFDATMSGMHLDPDPDQFENWHSSQAANGANYCGFSDPDVDRWLDAARTTFDQRERERLYQQVDRRLHEAQPHTFFFYPNSALCVPRDLAGVEVGPEGAIMFWPGAWAWRWTSARRAD